MVRDKYRLVEAWLGTASRNLRTAKEHAGFENWGESIQLSYDECIDLSARSALVLLDVDFPEDHRWTYSGMSGIAKQVRQGGLLTRLDANLVDIPRLLLLANFWGQFYLPVKYGYDNYSLAPPQDLFGEAEAKLAQQHALEAYGTASNLASLSDRRIESLLAKN